MKFDINLNVIAQGLIAAMLMWTATTLMSVNEQVAVHQNEIDNQSERIINVERRLDTLK